VLAPFDSFLFVWFVVEIYFFSRATLRYATALTSLPKKLTALNNCVNEQLRKNIKMARAYTSDELFAIEVNSFLEWGTTQKMPFMWQCAERAPLRPHIHQSCLSLVPEHILGMGVMTSVDIPSGTIVTYYGGRVLNTPPEMNSYVFEVHNIFYYFLMGVYMNRLLLAQGRASTSMAKKSQRWLRL
jgi:hypothetical protein